MRFIYITFFFISCLSFNEELDEELVITGTALTSYTTQIANPVYSIYSSDLEERGVLKLENFLSHFPQIKPSNSTFHSNKASGTSSISLRGLGGKRTLLLVDGKRLAPGSPINGHSEQDLTQIPLSLVKRIDILTGGKSTIYGADAIGGVINFILDRDFSGIEISYQHSFFNHQNDDAVLRNLHLSNNYNVSPNSVSDGHQNSISLTYGGDIFESTRMVGFINYRSIDEVNWSQRDISVCALQGNSICRGSSTSPEGKFSENRTGGNTYYVSGSDFIQGTTKYNFASMNHLQRPDTKIDTGILLSIDLENSRSVELDYFHSSYETVAQLDYSGIFRLGLNLPCSHPLLSSQQFNTICTQNGLSSSDEAPLYVSRRNIEGLPRRQDFSSTTDKLSFSSEGGFYEGWNYDLNINYIRTSLNFTFYNDISKSKATNALRVTGSVENPSCVSGQSCVPWNIFKTNSNEIMSSSNLGVTQEALDYISLNLKVDGELSQDQYKLIISKNFGLEKKFVDSLAVAIGVEHRNLNLKKYADNFSDGAGQQYPHSSLFGDLQVNEIFAEFLLPFNTETLLNLSARYSEYSIGEESLTYDFGIIHNITPQLVIKASHQKSVKIPDISELYELNDVEQVFLDSDPCSGVVPNRSFSECQRTGVTSALYGNIATSETQINSLQGGNPNLFPETAKTNSLSLIYSFKDSLDIEFDFYEINLDDQVGSPDASYVLSQCLDTGLPYFCNLIQRNPTTGTFFEGSGYISTPLLNISKNKTSGFDLSFTKKFMTNFGSITLNNFSNFLLNRDIQLQSSLPVEDCKGKYENTCGLPSPKIQNILSLKFNYEINSVEAFNKITIRYLDSVEDSNNSSKINFNDTAYLDSSFSMKFKEGFDFSFGVNNLLDQDPPLNGKSISYVPGNANTYPSYYDPLGRYVFFKLTRKIN